MMTEQAAGYRAGGPPGLELLAERMAQDPEYMAWILAEYRRQEGLSRERLYERLGITAEDYLRLATCRRPDRAHFAAHLQQIADYAGVDGLLLGNLIRQVDALARLSPRTIEQIDPQLNVRVQPAQAQTLHMRSTLYAARDRLHEDHAAYAQPAAAAAPESAHPKQAFPESDASPASGESPHEPAPDAPANRVTTDNASADDAPATNTPPRDAPADDLAGHREP